MSRDYKHVSKKKNKEPSPAVGNLLSFFTGLSLGLFIAFLVFLQYANMNSRTEEPAVVVSETDSKDPQSKEKSEPQAEEPESVPAPTFDFYKILPNKEINISEWVAEEKQDLTQNKNSESETYVLQVGSFKDYDAADQVKASLALIGIDADIQRVVINGQDIRHRVRVGPYKNLDKLMEIRKRLEDNNLNFMLLKLKADHIKK